MRTSLRCSKCEGRMMVGFILDRGYGPTSYGQAGFSTWQSGEPQSSFWVGIKQVKADQKPISSFRCERCGYIENYAA